MSDFYKRLPDDLTGREPHPDEVTTGSPEKRLAQQISIRASFASEKVKARAEEMLNNFATYGSSSERWLTGLMADFDILEEDPENEVGGGMYKGWSKEEIRELYEVLYDEEL